jgi:hypothetical protein
MFKLNLSSFIWVSSELKGYCEWKAEHGRTIVHRLKRETYNLLHLSSVFLKLLYEQSVRVLVNMSVSARLCLYDHVWVSQ